MELSRYFRQMLASKIGALNFICELCSKRFLSEKLLLTFEIPILNSHPSAWRSIAKGMKNLFLTYLVVFDVLNSAFFWRCSRKSDSKISKSTERLKNHHRTDCRHLRLLLFGAFFFKFFTAGQNKIETKNNFKGTKAPILKTDESAHFELNTWGYQTAEVQ